MEINQKKLESWIKGCQRNERYFQEKVYKHFFERMYRMLERRLSCRDDIMTVLNDGFLKAFKYCESYEFNGSFEGWLRRVMYSCLVDFVKSNKEVRSLIEFENSSSNSSNLGPELLYYEDVFKLLRRIPDGSREVFELYVIEGFKQSEIADKRGISEGTVKWHISNARKILTSTLKKIKKQEQYG